LSEPEPASPPTPWYRLLGRRNLAYAAFTVLLIPAAIWLESTGPRGPDSGGGIMAGLMLWGLASLAFFAVNAVLAVVAIVKGRPLAKPLLACALPLLIIAATMILQDLSDPY